VATKRRLLLLVTHNQLEAASASEVSKILEKQESWWHWLPLSWMVVTDQTPDALVSSLNPHLGKTGRVLVIEVKPNYQGWLPKEAWEWLNGWAAEIKD
jgi:hypothetical protein